MKAAVIIPARYASTRFPGKPLAHIKDKPLIQWVYENSLKCKGIDTTLIATDDNRIMDAVAGFGGKAVFTSSLCKSGTDRVAEVASLIEHEIIINIQGDQIVFDEVAVTRAIEALKGDIPIVTIATPASPREMTDPNTVKVVCDKDDNALYFSRSPLPYTRSEGFWQPLKHIGIYGFKRDILKTLTRLRPSPLEKTESLEQLRALENGIDIRVIVSKGNFFEINTPEDAKRFIESWQG